MILLLLLHREIYTVKVLMFISFISFAKRFEQHEVFSIFIMTAGRDEGRQHSSFHNMWKI